MESETEKQKRTLRFSEILHCLFYVVVVVFFLSCMVFQAFLFMDHLQTKQRLAAMDEKMNTFELTPKKPFPSSPPHTAAGDVRLDAEDLHVRLKRAVTVSLQNLEKRLKVLETRYDNWEILHDFLGNKKTKNKQTNKQTKTDWQTSKK